MSSSTRPVSPLPPMDSPQFLPTPLPSPPPFIRSKSSSQSFRRLRMQTSVDPPIPPGLIGSPLLQKTLPPKARFARSTEDLKSRKTIGLGMGFVDGYEFGVGVPPVSGKDRSRSRHRPTPLPLFSSNATPSSSPPARKHRRSPSIAIPGLRSPPLTPTQSSPPPPVPPIPTFLLEPGDHIVTKPILKPVTMNLMEEARIEVVGIPDLELGEESPRRGREGRKENGWVREEPMTCLKFFSIRNGAAAVKAY